MNHAPIRLEARAQRDAAWDAARARALPLPHFSDGWIAYRQAQGYRPLWLLAFAQDGGATPCAAGVAWRKQPRFRPWVRPEARLDRLPAAVDGAGAITATSAALAQALVELAQRERFARIELESFDGPWPAPDLATMGFTARERLEFVLDLAGDEPTRMSRIKSSHRRKVRAGEKSGVIVADESGRTDLDLLRALQGSTQERRADRGEEMELLDPQQYQRLAATFVAGGSGRLFVGRKDGEAVSAILCGVERSRAYYLMGGTSAAGFECNAATLVLWRAATLLAERGVTELNLGGVPRGAETEGHAQHGLWRFKEGFEPRRVECRSGTWQR
ncbi:MAG: GNAT family N-acetyltransferase [Planctomycetes bacterium]|nr:GNAT family N-acetyltransferase [Planctomycetota bacterium]